jgi:hypothetical protein
MTLSFNKLNEIAALYENIAASEQEQLDEVNYDVKAEKEAIKKRDAAFGWVGNQARRLANATVDSFKTDKNPTKGQDTFKEPKPASEAKPPSQQAKQEYAKSKGKYYSSSDQKTYKSEADAKSARAGRLKDLAAKQQASRGDSGAGGNGSGGTRPPGGGSQGSKVVPTKPASTPAKPAMGTTAGGTKFERRTPTRQEMDAAKRAGGGEAGVKAAVAASKPTTGPANATIDKGSVEASKAAFKPVTPSKAIASAPSTSAAASGGNAVSAANAIAAAPKPKPMVPTRMPLAQSFEYDAYDLVLEYLLSQGHAETVAEAQYLMTEMDAEMIGDIVEESLSEDANYDRNRKRAAQRAAARNAARDAGKTGAVPGVGYVTPRRESETYRDSTGTERHKSGARMPEKKG